MGRPFLTLIREHYAEDGIHPSPDLDEDNQWEIVFQMKIKNGGDVRAENWRVWFTPLDDTTSVLLDAGAARREAYRRDLLSGRNETILDEKTRVVDFCIEPREVRTIPGRHSILLGGKPSFVEIQFKLNADNMVTQYWMWRITIDWTTHRVLWNEKVSSEEEQPDPSQPFKIITNFLRRIMRISQIFGG